MMRTVKAMLGMIAISKALPTQPNITTNTSKLEHRTENNNIFPTKELGIGLGVIGAGVLDCIVCYEPPPTIAPPITQDEVDAALTKTN
jgi:hypothetical protein